MNTHLIQEALDEVGKSESIIARAETDLTNSIFAKLVEAAGKHDVVGESVKVALLDTALTIARAAVDWTAKGGGKLSKGATVPRHVLADFLGSPANIAFLAEKASAQMAMKIEATVLKRLRTRREASIGAEFSHQMELRDQSYIDSVEPKAMPMPTSVPAAVADAAFGGNPSGAIEAPLNSVYASAENRKEFSRFPAKKGKR